MKIIHANFDNFFRCYTRGQKGAGLLKYRVAQIAATLHNDAFETPGIQILLGGIIFFQIFDLYGLFQFWRTLPTPVSLVLVFIALVYMFLILVVCRFVAKPYCKSDQFLSTASQQRNRWIRRLMQSCCPIKLT